MLTLVDIERINCKNGLIHIRFEIYNNEGIFIICAFSRKTSRLIEDAKRCDNFISAAVQANKYIRLLGGRNE